MLSVRGLTIDVGGTLVVEGAGFTVRAGDRVGLVGRNGAGKTSLLRCWAGWPSPRPA
jgi:ATPase subunit of ABC transporter with duplicated ATPase domains